MWAMSSNGARAAYDACSSSRCRPCERDARTVPEIVVALPGLTWLGLARVVIVTGVAAPGGAGREGATLAREPAAPAAVNVHDAAATAAAWVRLCIGRADGSGAAGRLSQRPAPQGRRA